MKARRYRERRDPLLKAMNTLRFVTRRLTQEE
jgi:hypothetical protein